MSAARLKDMAGGMSKLLYLEWASCLALILLTRPAEGPGLFSLSMVLVALLIRCHFLIMVRQHQKHPERQGGGIPFLRYPFEVSGLLSLTGLGLASGSPWLYILLFFCLVLGYRLLSLRRYGTLYRRLPAALLHHRDMRSVFSFTGPEYRIYGKELAMQLNEICYKTYGFLTVNFLIPAPLTLLAIWIKRLLPLQG